MTEFLGKKIYLKDEEGNYIVPVAYSAKYSANGVDLDNITGDYANMDLSNLSATGEAKFANTTLSNITSISSNAQTLLNAIYQAKITGSAGDSSTPCYMSNGAWYPCSGLSSSLRCSSRTTISSTKPDMVIAQGGSGTSGYRVWSSGFKECWGVVSLTKMTYRYEVTFSMGGYSFINIPIILTTADRDTTSIPQTEGMAVNYSALSAWSAALMERDKGYFKFVGVGPNYNMQWYAFGY